jgi:hypothetical protein
MARRIMGLALIYALIVLLAPADADGAFYKGATASQARPAASGIDPVPALGVWMFSGGVVR